MEEFKIGRLRFTWAGEWDTGTFYNRDAVSQYNGKTYVCLEPHTSSDFYDDLNHVTPGGASTPYWTLMMDGKVWKQAWAQNSYYSLGNIVRYGGVVYVCTTQHMSGLQFDGTKWATYSNTGNWANVWTTNRPYGVGDIVKYGGIVYRCITNHISASSASLGLESHQSSWEVVNNGIDYKGEWSSSSEKYKVNDIVRNGPDLWISTSGHVSSSTFDTSKWQLWIPGLEFQTTWNSSAIYQPGDVVVYGGYSYVSLVPNNSNTIPSTSSANWELLTTGYNLRDDWQTGLQYRVGDVVRRNGQLFVAVQDSSSTDPQVATVSVIYKSAGSSGNTLSVTSVNGITTGMFITGNSFISGQTVISAVNENLVETEVENSTVTTDATGNLGENTIIVSDSTGIVVGMNVIISGTSFSTFVESIDGNELTLSNNNSSNVSGLATIGTNSILVDDSTGISPGMLATVSGIGEGTTVVSIDGNIIIISTVVGGTGSVSGIAQFSNPTVIISDVPDSSLNDNQFITFSGINSAFWRLVTPGVKWTGFWSSTIQYQIGDIALWKNKTYRCISPVVSIRPDTDTTHQNWINYIDHDPNNSLAISGDITTFVGNSTAVIPIGDDDKKLGIVNGLPTWKNINIVPKVYYVSLTGTDLPEYGITWDLPWRTIKYACETVQNGTEFQNAAYLIKQNKEFMIEEMYQWMLYQKTNNVSPFTSSSMFDEVKTRRDAAYIVDAVVYDLTRGGNSQTVASTRAFFSSESLYDFINDETAAVVEFIIPALGKLRDLVLTIIQNSVPTPNYQALNGIPVGSRIIQIVDANYPVETGSNTDIGSLFEIILTALTNQTVIDLPALNQGLTSTIFIKTGTFEEELPIVIPANVALVGDELRGTTVKPKVIINTVVTASNGSTDTFTVATTNGMTDNTPVQFVGTDIVGGLTEGVTYYVIGTSITETTFQVSENEDGEPADLINDVGRTKLYGGDAIKDMFYVRNGTGLRNMTCVGMLGTLTELNEFLTRRPTGGAFVSLDPGTGPDDTEAWIIRKSPYIQNVTNFGVGAIGLKIDGSIHNGGNKSIVCNDFTQIISDGIAIWCLNDALCEAVSVFSYYAYAGYFSEGGGKIRATNGNSSYGTYGVIAEGFDETETPITGSVFNQYGQANAQVQNAFGVDSELLKIKYLNAGVDYTIPVTNMLNHSNAFDNSAWVTNGIPNRLKNIASPDYLNSGWSIFSNSTGDSYLYQEIDIPTTGAQFSGLSGTNLSGSGTSATFNVTVNSTSYSVSVASGGTNYVVGNQIRILGSVFGGVNGTNDLTITVSELSGTSIQTVTSSGVVPIGSKLEYTFSIHCKQGTAPSFDVRAVYNNGASIFGEVNFNFNTAEISYNEIGDFTPSASGVTDRGNGWYRIWFTISDPTALSDTLRFVLYPTSDTLDTYSYFYGAQIEIGTSMNFYLNSVDSKDMQYAYITVVGAGAGAKLVANEIRSNSIFQTRITDLTGSGKGGDGYLTSANSSQGGNTQFIVLSQSETRTAANYVGMRLMIDSGTGAGQYGLISSYNPSNKYAYILKESFTPAIVTAASSSTNLFSLASSVDINSLYIDQPVQFIPTYYTTSVTSVSQDTLTVTSVNGGLENTLYMADTSRLTLSMPVTFSGEIFGGVISDYTYYVSLIIDSNRFQISAELFGPVWFLQTGTGSMTLNIPSFTSYMKGSTDNMDINMPVQFTGTSLGGVTSGVVYYINDILDANTFTISNSILNISISEATSTEFIGSTVGLIALNPIVFSGTLIGGVSVETKYYISKINDSTHFEISDDITIVLATSTTTTSNLITVSDTSEFVIDNPIVFVGTTLGGLIADRIYYISAINDSTTFTVSETEGGSAKPLTSAVGEFIVKTALGSRVLTPSVGVMVGNTTAVKRTLTPGSGLMNVLFSTPLFGGISSGTTYYIRSINQGTPNTVSITATSNGVSPVSLTSAVGSMQFGQVGWDHVKGGTPPESILDSSSLYFIEPRTIFSEPEFSQSAGVITVQPPGVTYSDCTYGDGYFIAIPYDADGRTLSISLNGVVWTSASLPDGDLWASIAYGNKFWIIIGESTNPGNPGAKVLISSSSGASWKTSYLPPDSTWGGSIQWAKINYGNGIFVAVANGSAATAYSNDYGQTWLAGSGLSSSSWKAIAYGVGKFVIISDGDTYAHSINGATWTEGSITAANETWNDIAFGNGRFVVICDEGTPVYSFDAITWYASPYTVDADHIEYGQGVFVATRNSGTVAYTSEDGYLWKVRSVTNNSGGIMAYGLNSAKVGTFSVISGTNSASVIYAGCKAKGRPEITSNKINRVTKWETGSGYISSPTISFFDPNTTSIVTTEVRKGNGVLSGPMFLDPGQGYNTTSTEISIVGSGYADEYQIGLTVVCDSITQLPRPGDNLIFENNDIIYKVTSATILDGTVAPTLKVSIQISPEMTTQLSPTHGDDVLIRQQYSQVRLTNHDFLNIGFGNFEDSNHPGIPEPNTTELSPQNQAVETNYGRVFYTSTDQDGNFKVGSLFGVEQSTGIVTLSASQFDLGGLSQLSLGGIAIGGSGVVINQFSTDPTFVANSNNVVPTQKAIKSYISGRLSQGGSNTFTGQTIAGRVIIGGVNRIDNTVPQGIGGSDVVLDRRVNFTGGGVDGDMMALQYFIQSWVR